MPYGARRVELTKVRAGRQALRTRGLEGRANGPGPGPRAQGPGPSAITYKPAQSKKNAALQGPITLPINMTVCSPTTRLIGATAYAGQQGGEASQDFATRRRPGAASGAGPPLTQASDCSQVPRPHSEIRLPCKRAPSGCPDYANRDTRYTPGAQRAKL